jgi:hypothetical protein
MRALGLTAVVLTAAASAVFAGGDASILGKEAPAITTAEFLNSDGRTQIADFKGEVLFIECFATW